MSAPARTFTVRNVQLVRALLAAAAAVMITFSPDHSAAIGLSVFSGFAIATALVHVLSAWLVYPAGRRWPAVVMAALSFLAGMAGGFPMWRSEDLFFAIVISWALTTGLVELIVGLRGRRTREPAARDEITVGALGLLLGVLLLVVPAGFLSAYSIDGTTVGWLTGIILGVGLFGGYVAIVAVFLGIAGLTPKKADAAAQPEHELNATEGAPGGER